MVGRSRPNRDVIVAKAALHAHCMAHARLPSAGHGQPISYVGPPGINA